MLYLVSDKRSTSPLLKSDLVPNASQPQNSTPRRRERPTWWPCHTTVQYRLQGDHPVWCAVASARYNSSQEGCLAAIQKVNRFKRHFNHVAGALIRLSFPSLPFQCPASGGAQSLKQLSAANRALLAGKPPFFIASFVNLCRYTLDRGALAKPRRCSTQQCCSLAATQCETSTEACSVSTSSALAHETSGAANGCQLSLAPRCLQLVVPWWRSQLTMARGLCSTPTISGQHRKLRRQPACALRIPPHLGTKRPALLALLGHASGNCWAATPRSSVV